MSKKEPLKETFRSYEELRIICGAARETAFRNPNSPIFREIILPDNTIRRDKKKIKEISLTDILTHCNKESQNIILWKL